MSENYMVNGINLNVKTSDVQMKKIKKLKRRCYN